jgi:hypothetical protein
VQKKVRMRGARLIGVGLLALGMAATAAVEGRFGWLGLAPVQAGQTLAQAEAALGAPLLPPTPPPQDPATCHLRNSAARPGVHYVVDQGRVLRMETRDPRHATVSGVRVGDEVQRVRRLYGDRLSVRAHDYFARGQVLAVYSPDRRYALVMESNDAGRIVTLRGGLVPAVEFLAGCSP